MGRKMKTTCESAELILQKETHQNWNDSSELALCLEFIDAQKLHPQFRRFIRKQVKEENRLSAE